MIDWTEGFMVMPRSLRNPEHPYHPMNDKGAKGRGVSLAFALEDLIQLARWKGHGGCTVGQGRAAVRFLAQRWNTPKSTVYDMLKRFEADGYIRRISQPGYKQADVIEIVGYGEFVARRRTAYLQAVSDAESPITTGEYSEASDASVRRFLDKEDPFATRKLEVRREGKQCVVCCGEMDEQEPSELCIDCTLERRLRREADEELTAPKFRVIHRIALDSDAVVFTIASPVAYRS